MKISSVFSYYGGKSKLVDYYPAPKFGVVIEPFCGAAAYAWRWRDREVWINDLDSRTFSIWQFLQSEDAVEWVKACVPLDVPVGWKVSEHVPPDAPPGLIELMRAEANRGTQGKTDVNNSVTSMAAKCWPRFRPKMEEVIPQIAHWTITNLSYEKLFYPDNATWFIDPPYANAAGSKYRQASVDFALLGEWCRSRAGQVIVCENEGAEWLPFVPLREGRAGFKSRYQKSEVREVVYTQ